MTPFVSVEGMGHNGRGQRIDFDKMAEFDALPLCIRQVLIHAPYSYNPRQVREAWQRSGMAAQQYASERMPRAIERDVRKRSLLS